MRVTNIQLLSSNNGGGEGGTTQQQYPSSNTPENSFEKNSYAQAASNAPVVNKSDVEMDGANGSDLPF
jgi:hypothetical protein